MPTVMVVESHDDTREMLAAFLRYAGLSVVEAATTDAALIAADRAHVVVTAIAVRGNVDGLGLIRTLRYAQPGRRIIVCTTCSVPQVEQEARAAGCDAFMRKPCPPGALLDTIRALEPQLAR